ncbi:MAG: DUF4349 domain-containing protein [Roseiflexaceae bacterium]|nr:DUF4349 domain-containing protein [Roseiflexaceae bacterium]
MVNNKFLLLAVALVLSACGGSSAGSPVTQSAPANSTEAMTAEEAPAAPATDASENGAVAGGAPSDQARTQTETQIDQQAFERMVIKTADMSIQVLDVRAAEAALRSRTATLGGYIVQSQSTGSDEYMALNISVRVPSNRFDEALGDVQGLAEEVLSSALRGDDVTEEFVDLDSRRQTLEATRDRLRALLAEAKTVEDTLMVNQTLTEYQVEIDQIVGRQKFLSQSSAMSTINVAIAPVPAVEPIVSEDGWQPLTVAQDSLRGLVGFGQGLATLLIVLLVWSPVWGTLLLVVWLFARRLRGAPRQQQAG